jgi:uncharacterized membrane protein
MTVYPTAEAPLPDATATSLPTSAGEKTTAMVHYYRAEMARMASWRARLDLTSNWAITVVAAMLSVSLSTPSSHHGVLLFAMLLISLLLFVEGRRYRFYDVYRQRVRQFERHYFGQVFGGEVADSQPWLAALAEDLRHPKFRISRRVAITRRLRRNYIWMFGILLLAWVLKITSPKLQEPGTLVDTATPLLTIVEHASLGPLPGWLTIALVLALNCGIATIAFGKHHRAEDDEVQV